MPNFPRAQSPVPMLQSGCQHCLGPWIHAPFVTCPDIPAQHLSMHHHRRQSSSFCCHLLFRMPPAILSTSLHNRSCKQSPHLGKRPHKYMRPRIKRVTPGEFTVKTGDPFTCLVSLCLNVRSADVSRSANDVAGITTKSSHDFTSRRVIKSKHRTYRQALNSLQGIIGLWVLFTA
jgi:hypothetical protein